jgi:hypothetical protein
LVAVYIFALGGGLAIYRDISHLREPTLPENVGWNYAVLALAAIFIEPGPLTGPTKTFRAA